MMNTFKSFKTLKRLLGMKMFKPFNRCARFKTLKPFRKRFDGPGGK